MEYTMISADDHIDLGYLPKDLWIERLPKSLRERAPHVEDRGEKGEFWVATARPGRIIAASGGFPDPSETRWPWTGGASVNPAVRLIRKNAS